LARDVLPLLEGQLAAGMRPSLLTPTGITAVNPFLEAPKRESIQPVSLLHTWNHVREWRSLMNESAAETSSEILHAHSFSAGMAAVRASSCVVYQLKQPVEKLAAAVGHCDENSWLARSFRVAEQFVLTRAAAVVVHDHTQRLACLERGVKAANAFLIPQPIEHSLLESAPERRWLIESAGAGPDTVFLLIPGLPTPDWESRDALLRWMRVLCNVRREHPDVRLVVLAETQARDTIWEMASACNLTPWISVLPTAMQDRALASADIVICDREHAQVESPLRLWRMAELCLQVMLSRIVTLLQTGVAAFGSVPVRCTTLPNAPAFLPATLSFAAPSPPLAASTVWPRAAPRPWGRSMTLSTEALSANVKGATRILQRRGLFRYRSEASFAASSFEVVN